MGGKMIVTDYHGINIIEFPDKSTKDLHGLKYHNSWDALMTVTGGFVFKYQMVQYSG